MTPMLKEVESLQQQAVRELHEEVCEEREKRLAQRKVHADEFTENALIAIGRLADALRDPMNPGRDMREARYYFEKALTAAFRMEPDDFDDDAWYNGGRDAR